MQNILAAVDLSPISERVIECAAEIASGQDARLWLVHVAAPDPDFAGYEAGPQEVRDQVASTMQREHRALQQHAEALRTRGLDATALSIQGPTTEKIVEEAQHLEADLIVVGSHGHGLAYRALLGSVSTDLLKRAKVPVVVVPRAD